MFGKKEVIAILVSIFVISFIFGFDDGNVNFNLSFWLVNFLRIILVVAISILLRELIMKVVARRKGCDSEYEIWNVKRYWFYESNVLKKGVPITSIIALLLTFFSNGKIFFTAIGKNIIRANRYLRGGRKFLRLTQIDDCFIISAGILTTTFLVIFFSFLNKVSWLDFSLIITTNIWLTIWGLLPLPPLNAGRLFMGSRVLYVFVLSLVLIMFLLKDVNIILNLILSLIIGGVIVSIYYYIIEY